MRFLLLPTLFLLTNAFDDVRIEGQPSLTCTSKYAIISFETSEPFQGRVSVIHNNDSSCTSEFSFNLNNNATVFIDLERCTQSHFANLAVTNFDRVFHLQCIDNSFVTSSLSSTDANLPIANCSHSTRPASRWESSTFFRLGDSVVHEWNCIFDKKEHGKYNTFLTSCNAISRSGEVIHLVDENGCIVDPELLGELVYNNYTSRIYGRARMFRFASGEMYRMECHLQMCLKATTCGQRSTPPRCAYTKEDFERRYDPRAARNGESNFTPVLLSDGGPFDHDIKVSSDWITVHNNHFTDIDQITERFYLSTELNRSAIVSPPRRPKHFLLGLSSKDGQDQSENILIEEALRLATNMETTFSSLPSSTVPAHPTEATVSATIPMSVFSDIGTGTNGQSVPVAESFTPPTIITSTTDPGFFEASTSFPPLIPEFSTQSPPTLLKITKEGMETVPIVTEPPGVKIDAVNRMTVTRQPPIHKHVDRPGSETKRTFHTKSRDWRLDDGSFNDTESLPANNISCANNTQLLTAEISSVCRWSGFEHLLLVWSILSLIGWICLAVFVVYRYQRHRPEWVEFRTHDSIPRPPPPSCSREIPWSHPDAFEHRLRHAYRPSVHSSHEAVFRN